MHSRRNSHQKSSRSRPPRRSVMRLLALEDRINPAALLPDLHILQSYLSGWTVNNLGGNNREVRFATAMANGGAGPFETRGTSTIITDPDGTQRQLVNQRIYNSDGSFTDQFAGYFTYHPTHGHIHFDDMAWGQLRIRGPGDTIGDVVAVGPKTSFCLIDINHYNSSLPGSPANSVYNSCNPVFQGISVGWNDVYSSGLDGQSINVTGIPNGNYWLEVVADPLNHIQETDETNNVTRVPITLSNLPQVGFIAQSSTPLGAQSTPVSYVEYNFNQPVDPTTFTASSVTVTGPNGPIPITGVTQVSSVKFRANFATQANIGTYTATLQPTVRSANGALLDQNNNGTGGEPGDTFITVFTIAAPQVQSVTPNGTVSPPVTSIRVTYNRPMQSNTFTTFDIFSFTGPGGVNLLPQVAAVTPVTAGNLSAAFDISFTSNLTNPGAYQIVIEPTVLDSAGNPIDQNGDGQSNSQDRFTANFGISTPGVAGPDAFGYDGVTSQIRTKELVGQSGTVSVNFSNSDDGFAAINLGTSTFNYYGTTYTGNNQLFVTTNGLLTFGSGTTSYQNDDMSSLTQPAIAVLWDDWIIGTGSPQAIYKIFDDNNDGVNDRIVIEWNQVYHYSSSPSGVTFQVELRLNTGSSPGGIFFNYQDLDSGDGNANGASATVGLHVPAAGGNKQFDLMISRDGSSSLVGNQKGIKIGVPLVSSIVREDPNPIDAGDMEFLVTFDHPVTGVDVSDFTLTTTGAISGAYIDHIHTTADPGIYEVHVKSGVGSGTLKLNLIDNDSIASISGARLGGIGNGNGNFTNSEVYNVVQQPPTVQGFNIDDGTAQHSVVRQIQVVFDKVVTFAGNPANAFVLTGPNGAVPVNVDLSLSTPVQTVARLTFSGAGSEFGSLADGNYTLRVVASQISTGGVLMTADATTSFYRLFGDVNGDRRIDIADYGQFGSAYNSAVGNPNYRPYFDFNGDGRIDIADYGQFGLRYLTNLP